MTQLGQDIHQFNLCLSEYKSITTLGWLLIIALVLIASVTVILGVWLWGTYTHNFTLYLKWQDALLSLSWFVAFLALGGSILAGRFLHAVHAGYTQGMIFLRGNTLRVRDLSSKNFASIFWVMNSAFWCFIAVLVGLSPAILIGWTLHFSSPLLVVIATTLAVILGLAGLIVSLIALSFILIGCVGSISFCRKLGSSYAYELDGRISLSIDRFVLTIIQPDRPECMVDLHLLSEQDQTRLLLLLRQNWIHAEQKWSPSFGAEITQTLKACSIKL